MGVKGRLRWTASRGGQSRSMKSDEWVRGIGRDLWDASRHQRAFWTHVCQRRRFLRHFCMVVSTTIFRCARLGDVLCRVPDRSPLPILQTCAVLFAEQYFELPEWSQALNRSTASAKGGAG